jgi:NTP pyrophosphatase (non-canonical NTP hydrolase)
MPLTLSEAQIVSWKIFRKINDKLNPQRGSSNDPFIIVMDFLEEAGEVASVVKGMEGFKQPEKPITKEMLAKELSDMLYEIFVLAEHYGISLEETFLEHVNDYMLHFLTRV